MSTMLCDTNDLYFAFLDLTAEDKRALLARTDSGPRALPHIEAMRDRLAAAVTEGKAFTAELSAADRRHDLGCMALELVCRAHETLAALPEYAHLRTPIERIRGALTLGGGLTNASYVVSATTATRNRNSLPDCIDDLRAIPITAGVTAADVAEIFIGGGEETGRWLSRRADVEAAANAARSADGGRTLLNEARALLNRLRTTVEGEVSWRDDLPDDLPGRIFAALDARVAAAVARSRGGRDSGVGRDAAAELAAEAEADAVDTAPPAVVEPEGADEAGGPLFIPRPDQG